MTSISERNPFVGPRSIQPGETLPGRMAEVRDLFHRLQARRIVVLHSASGAGKSSLVNAGLIPLLRESNFDVWKTIRVNLDPAGLDGVPAGTNRYLLSAMVSLEDELPVARRRTPAELAGRDFGDYVLTRPRRKASTDRAVVLLFDQFEEILTVAPWAVAEKRAFFRAVGKALENENIWALFIVRADYLAALAPYRDAIPTQLANTYHLDLLGLVRAREAAEQLARQGGRSFPGVERLVNDLATVQVQQPDGSFKPEQGAYIEPVQLQVVCRRLWQVMPDDDLSIDPEDVSQYADVTKALAAYYAQAVELAAGGNIAAERAIREWMGQKLIVSGIRSQVRHEAAKSGGLDNALIAQLLAHYLVRAEQRAGANWYELSHDRLVGPIRADNQAWESAHLHPLQVHAQTWEAAGRKQELLLSAEALEGAATWAQKNAHLLTESEREYLDLSRALRAHEASLRVRQRRFAQVIAAAGIAAAAFGAYAWQQRERAEQASREARAGQQAAQLHLAANLEERGRNALLDGDLHEAAADLLESYRLNRKPATTRLLLARALALRTQRAGLALGVQGDGAIESAQFSPDGKLAVVAPALPAGLARVWDVASGKLITTLQGHDQTVVHVSFSHDGTRAATSSLDRTVRLWDTQTWKLLGTLQAEAEVGAAAFDPSDPTRLLSGHGDGSAWLWDIREPARATHQACIPKGAWQWRTRLDFSTDGKRLMTQGAAEVRVWQTSKCRLQATMARPQSYRFVAAALSPDGKWVATTGDSAGAATPTESGEWSSPAATASIWSAETGRLQLNLFGKGSAYGAGDLAPVAFSPDGALLVTCSLEAAPRVWSKDGNLVSELVGHSDTVTTAAFSRDGERIVTTGWDNTAHVWNARTGHLDATLEGHTDRVTRATFDTSGRRVLTTSADGAARVWNVEGTLASSVLRGHKGPVNSVSYSSDGDRIVTASDDGSVRVWGAKSGEPQLELAGHTDFVLSASFSPDARWIVSASVDKTARVWDARTGQELHKLQRHEARVNSASFNRDGTRVLTASDDGWALLWDAHTGKQILEPMHMPSGPIFSASFSPDGNRVLTVSGATEEAEGARQTASVWDATTGKPIKENLGEAVVFASFSPDGQRVATGVSLALWNASTGEEIPVRHLGTKATALVFHPSDWFAFASEQSITVVDSRDLKAGPALRGHTGMVELLAVNPQVPWLASVSSDLTVRVWDPARGAALLVFEGHKEPVLSVSFSPDGRQLATAGQDGTVRLWNMAQEARTPEELEASLRSKP